MTKPPLPKRTTVKNAIQDAIDDHKVDLVEAEKIANDLTPAMAEALLSAKPELNNCLIRGTYPTLNALHRRGLVHRHRYATPGHAPRTYQLTPLGRAVARRRAKIGIKPAPKPRAHRIPVKRFDSKDAGLLYRAQCLDCDHSVGPYTVRAAVEQYAAVHRSNTR